MILFEKAFEEVSELVHKFDEHKDQFMAHNYQEAHVRTDFLDGFWTALGWDVRHREQTNPREQEVKIEKSDTAGSTRRVDYAFRLKPDYKNTVFFCEAKKPSVDLANADDYFQLVQYGYSASTPIGVLTNFDEFHIIDCRYQPHIEKSYPSAQIKVFGYKDYLDKEAFGFIYWLFSREAIAAGELKKYAAGLPKQRGTGKTKLTAEEAKPVDEAFLIKLEEYRRTLAKAFKKADESLTAEVLTEATQKVIDRLVFIRFLEDKYIEADYIVDQIAAVRTGTGDRGPGSAKSSPPTPGPRNPVAVRSAWKSFLAWSKELDVKYNGVVFKPHDIDKPTFAPPDDKVFSELCNDISHSHSKYLFTYIPIELLGSIYERFLGKVVTTTPKQAKIEDKPEVRKAGGVYYTPKYIVDYIVSNTVGKIIEGKKPKEISALHFADIACGSGSFLIAVYDIVLHYVEKWYNDNPEEARKAKCNEMERGVFAITLKQKQQILLDNIYGVDIDRQAVEVAQLSLFLKLLESESGATAEQLSFERTKILPDLSKNIQCGNSLVEYDILDKNPLLFKEGAGGGLTPQEEMKIKPFSFSQAFKPIMDAGGFDTIVGNPPYVQIYFGTNTENLLPYFMSRYSTTEYQPNTSGLFMERSIQLLNSKGKSGLIVPNYWLSTKFDTKLRAFLFQTNKTEMIVNTYRVFAEASVDTVLVFARRAIQNEDHTFELRSVDRNFKTINERLDAINAGTWAFTGIQDISADTDVHPSFSKKIDLNVPEKLGEVFNFGFGMKPYQVGKGKPPQNEKVVEEKAFTARTQVDSTFTKLLRASSVKRYELKWDSDWIKYGNHLAEPRTWDLFTGPRILLQRIVSGYKLDATFVTDTYICNTDVITLQPRSALSEEVFFFYLGILASSLCSFHVKSQNVNLDRATYPKINTNTLATFPTPVLKDATKIANLVRQMLVTKKQLTATQRESEREQLQRKCDYLDAEIDKLVYALYGLTEEEIRIVEGEEK